MKGLFLMAAAIGAAVSVLGQLPERSGAGRPVCANAAEIAEQVASDVSNPVRQGGVEGRAFWNGRSVLFMHPPAFGFAKVPGAVRYRYDVRASDGAMHSFEAKEPDDSLAAVWMRLPEGMTGLEVVGLNEKGKELGAAGSRRFWKSAAFDPGKCPPGVCGYSESALMYLDWLFRMPNTQSYLLHGVPDESYPYNAYPSKSDSAVVNAFVCYAALRPDRKDAALTVARRAADHLLSLMMPPGSPLEHFPHTYRVLNPPNGFAPKDQGANKIAKKYQGQVMVVYPAVVGRAFINLFNATGDAKYRDAAIRIAGTYLKLQGEDGTWCLKVRESDGQPVAQNRLFPLGVCDFLEDIYAVTGDERFRAASDRAFEFVEKGPLAVWNWDAQFEDVAPSGLYRNLTIHTPVATALHLLKRYPGDMKRREIARECLRFAEDQFVLWRLPFGPDGTGPLSPGTAVIPASSRKEWFDVPQALEQYDWYLPIDGSASKMIKGYLAFYRAEGRAVDLAKARALGDAITIMQKKHGKGGGFPTHWTTMEVGSDMSPWINCGTGTAQTLMSLANP